MNVIPADVRVRFQFLVIAKFKASLHTYIYLGKIPKTLSRLKGRAPSMSTNAKVALIAS
jgi:hypothetical protein